MATTLATVVEARGGDLDYIESLLQDGRKRQKPRHSALLPSAAEESGETSEADQDTPSGQGKGV